ncbi:MAG TPA: hypothetical protein VI455_12280 [Terriglobia bacterium]
MLALHFQDLARLCLELQAWERIRDARLEHRWQQVDLQRRRLFHEMERDLLGTAKEVFEVGLQHLEDSPAKFKQQAEALEILKYKLRERDFKVEHVLRKLYGQQLDAISTQAQWICLTCKELMKTQDQAPLTEREFENLLATVEDEEQDAQQAYVLELDRRTTTRAACLAGLGPRSDDMWMEQQGDQLRRAIDRKQWVITGLLQTLGLAGKAKPKRRPRRRKPVTPPPHPPSPKLECDLESTR